MRFAWLLVLIFATAVPAQVGVWRGRAYTPQSFSRATWCNCAMCQSLRSQWARSAPRTTPTVAATVTGYRTEYQLRTRTVKRCNGRRCWFEQVKEMVPVRVPVSAPTSSEPAPKLNTKTNTELQSTPEAAVEAVFDLIPWEPGQLFMDLGCGDGRLLEAASDRGLRAVGVELDSRRAERVRRRLRGRATVITGDVRDVAIGNVDVLYMWLYPDLIEEIDLPEGATIVSYRHRFPGARRVVVDGHTFFIRR